jgi:hypothetical protein
VAVAHFCLVRPTPNEHQEPYFDISDYRRGHGSRCSRLLGARSVRSHSNDYVELMRLHLVAREDGISPAADRLYRQTLCYRVAFVGRRGVVTDWHRRLPICLFLRVFTRRPNQTMKLTATAT